MFVLVSCVLIISHTSMHGYPCPCRSYRYFKPKGGKVKCSPEAMQMWESKSGRFPAAININMQFKTSHNGPVSTIYNWYPPATEVRSWSACSSNMVRLRPWRYKSRKKIKVPGRCQEWRLVYSFSTGDKGRLVQARVPVYFAIQSINFYPMIFDGHSLLNRYNLKIIGHTSQYPEVNGDKGHSMAQKTGNIRVNEVHGEQEIRLILNETFVHKELPWRRNNSRR